MAHCRGVMGLLLLSAAVLVTGCSVVDEKRQTYRTSESIAPLQVPESLDSPVSGDALVLPVLQQSGSVDAAIPFDTRPPAPVNLPPEVKPEAKE